MKTPKKKSCVSIIASLQVSSTLMRHESEVEHVRLNESLEKHVYSRFWEQKTLNSLLYRQLMGSLGENYSDILLAAVQMHSSGKCCSEFVLQKGCHRLNAGRINRCWKWTMSESLCWQQIFDLLWIVEIRADWPSKGVVRWIANHIIRASRFSVDNWIHSRIEESRVYRSVPVSILGMVSDNVARRGSRLLLVVGIARWISLIVWKVPLMRLLMHPLILISSIGYVMSFPWHIARIWLPADGAIKAQQHNCPENLHQNW